MPSSGDAHDPRFDLDRQDNLVLLALGEAVSPEFQAHQATCDQCQRELAGYADTVRLAQESVAHRDVLAAEPPTSIWAGIQSDLELANGARAQLHAVPVRRGMAPRWRRTLLVAAAVIILGAGIAGGYVAGSRHAAQTVASSSAQLRPVEGGLPNVSGEATVHTSSSGAQLTVMADGLPLRTGYYEVWLYSPTANNMVAIGTLGTGGKGSFTLPSGIDLRNYHVVDVSAQDYTGGSVITHQQSVLQGPLTQ